MADRPAHLACIAHTHADRLGQSWCGRTVTAEWHFVSIDHAAYAVQQRQRLRPCPQCCTMLTSLFSLATAPWGTEED